MTAPKPVRHRAPVQRLHADGTTCTHKIKAGDDCPGIATYKAVCTCGQWEREETIRAIVDEMRSLHIRNGAAA
ncbi:hypothetical protein [Nonomuraea sp. NPDC003214]